VKGRVWGRQKKIDGLDMVSKEGESPKKRTTFFFAVPLGECPSSSGVIITHPIFCQVMFDVDT
jgi:hypothetical protein